MEVYINKTKKWHFCKLVEDNNKTSVVYVPDLKYKNAKEYGIEIKVNKNKLNTNQT